MEIVEQSVHLHDAICTFCGRGGGGAVVSEIDRSGRGFNVLGYKVVGRDVLGVTSGHNSCTRLPD